MSQPKNINHIGRPNVQTELFTNPKHRVLILIEIIKDIPKLKRIQSESLPKTQTKFPHQKYVNNPRPTAKSKVTQIKSTYHIHIVYKPKAQNKPKNQIQAPHSQNKSADPTTNSKQY